MESLPFKNHLLGLSRQITFSHKFRLNFKNTIELTIKDVNMRWLMLSRLKEHLDHQSIKSRNFRHCNPPLPTIPHSAGLVLSGSRVATNYDQQ